MSDQEAHKRENAPIPAPALVGLVVALVIAVQIAALRLLGRPMLCDCGVFKVWTSQILSTETSQQLSDWYSFTHVEHGLLFYFLGWLFFPRLPVTYRYLLALMVEVGWEILENSPSFVQLYRQQALAVGYSGDSILNSVADVGFMSLGFLFAALAPVWTSLALLVVIELSLATMIRDSLALNILNFIHPVDAVARWQSGGN